MGGATASKYDDLSSPSSLSIYEMSIGWLLLFMVECAKYTIFCDQWHYCAKAMIYHEVIRVRSTIEGPYDGSSGRSKQPQISASRGTLGGFMNTTKPRMGTKTLV
jgi:hypothetical protein